MHRISVKNYKCKKYFRIICCRVNKTNASPKTFSETQKNVKKIVKQDEARSLLKLCQL